MKQTWYCGNCMKEYKEENKALTCCYKWKVKAGANVTVLTDVFTDLDLKVLWDVLHKRKVELYELDADDKYINQIKRMMRKVRPYIKGD